MKKEALYGFLAGMVLPLFLAAVFQQIPREDAARHTEPDLTTAPALGADAMEVAVLDREGRVQQMELGEYLTGVVLAEMPASFEEEALRAQAVVARTYTRKRMMGSKHEAAAVCMDPACCQSWKSAGEYLDQGGETDAVEKIRRAVADTDGLVLTYGGKLIDATYFSCSGGSTEDAVAVWGQDVPYLQAVESPGEEEAPRYTETVRFSPAEFAERMGIDSGGDPGDWFGAVTYTDGGGVDAMVIRGEAFEGTRLRTLLGLRSTAFELRIEGGQIVITTRGFGHRVGMSQYGAQAMAERGSGFREILQHYYQGTEVVFSEG